MFEQHKFVSPSQGRKYNQPMVLVLMAAYLLTACSPGTEEKRAKTGREPIIQEGKPTGAPAPSKEHVAARMEQCRKSLEAAIPTGLVSNASVDNGRPILWVGPGWRRSTAAAKEQVVRDTACFFLSGDESKTIQFSIYDVETDRELAVWNRTHLVTP